MNVQTLQRVVLGNGVFEETELLPFGNNFSLFIFHFYLFFVTLYPNTHLYI